MASTGEHNQPDAWRLQRMVQPQTGLTSWIFDPVKTKTPSDLTVLFAR
jgi:hypothetical protein